MENINKHNDTSVYTLGTNFKMFWMAICEYILDDTTKWTTWSNKKYIDAIDIPTTFMFSKFKAFYTKSNCGKCLLYWVTVNYATLKK